VAAVKLTGVYDLRCRACSYEAKALNRREADKAIADHQAKHHGSESHIPVCLERLPLGPVVGDRVRIKGPAKPGDKDLRKEFEQLYGERAWKEHVVAQEFDRKLYGEAMFQLSARGDEARIIVRPGQVELAWRNDEERRAGLAAAQERAA